MKCEIPTKHRKFEVAVGKEDKKRNMFLHFYASSPFLPEFSWNFERPRMELGNKRLRRQAIFAGFQKVKGGNR